MITAALLARIDARAQDDDVIIIIEDDAPPAQKPAEEKPAGDDDEIIIIEDDTAPPAPTGPRLPRLPGLPAPPAPPLPPLPLGELPIVPGPADPSVEEPSQSKRAFAGIRSENVALTGRLGGRTSIRPLGTRRNDVWRNLAEGVLAVDIRPDEAPIRVHADLYTRFRWNGGVSAPDVVSAFNMNPLALRRAIVPGGRASGMLEVGEAYAAMKLKQMRFVVGRQLVSWTSSVNSILPGLINPQFARDGLAFPDELSARHAVFAFQGRGALGPVGLEMLVIPFYAPPRFTFFAEDSEAWDFNENVLSLAATRNGFSETQSAAVERSVPIADQLRLGEFAPTVGLRAFFSLRQADLTVMVVFGQDPTPVLSMDPSMSRVLARTADRRGSKDIQPILAGQCNADGCAALETSVRATWRRTLLAQIDVNGTVGPGVLRGMFHVAPWLTNEVSRTVHVITRDGRLESANAWSAGVSLAYETGYTEIVQGFIEIGYDMVGGIPDGARIARLEPVDMNLPGPRLVHRPTASIRVQGEILDDIAWRLRATVAPFQREFGIAPRVAYQLSLSQEVGLGVDMFAGLPGTRGYFLMPMSRMYADWAYRF